MVVGKPKRKKLLGRTRHRLERNIEVNVRDIDCGVREWIDLALYRHQWRVVVSTEYGPICTESNC
jgi:hypothetical protein